MRKHLKLLLALFAASLLPGLAKAQVAASASVGFRLDLPVVLPQLVVVTPGVQVVPDIDHEVFFVDGYYWARHDRGWYKSKSHRRGWVLVGPRYVPARLVGIPHGKYRRYRPGRDHRPMPAPAAYRSYDRDRDDRHEHHDRDHHDREHHDHGKHGKHGGKHGKGKHRD